MNYEVVVGLEVHAELSTDTKVYCSCKSAFGGEVNTLCCPVCTGMPGALPVLNKKVVEYAAKMGLATGCRINQVSKQDRKNYFYPDLPKAYQISQFDMPLCEGGRIDFYHDGKKKTVRLTRIHIEEDAGKLLHEESFKGTLVDFNRCGVPLIEIVSEPDIRSASEAKDYLEAVRMLLATLDICDCRMQEGSIRCDINVSVRPEGQKEYGTRVEMKNVNTFSGAVRAIEYESKRQIEVLEAGGTIDQETRRWDDAKGVNVLLRSKEDAHDYRYFPEPDLLPIVIDDKWLDEIKNSIPELPVAKYERYRGLGIPEFEAWLLVDSAEKAAFFEACARIGGISLKTAANWITGDLTALLNEKGIAAGDSPVSPKALCEILAMVEKNEISLNAGKRVLAEMFETGGSPLEIVDKLSLRQVSDEAELIKLVREVLAENEKSVADYKNGKSNALGYLVGQCMRRSKGKGNPQVLNKLLKAELD